MRVAVTGASGKVGRAATLALLRDGHEVRAVDLGPPVFERDLPSAAHYVQADMTDAGEAYAVLRGMEAVVHAGAIPAPGHHADHRVFSNNLMAVFNTVEAAVRWQVRRFVNISSETVPGFFFAERPFLPDYAPVDEEHPIRPQDPYALAKHFGEQLMDAAVRRSDLAVITLRPSWVQWEGNYERNLGPMVRDASVLAENLWSYIDLYDLADAIALATQSDLPGHVVCYIASPDNATGRNFGEILQTYYGDRIELRETQRPDASGIDTRKAQRLLGWRPTRSWRDYLDDNGRLREDLDLPGWASGMSSVARPGPR